MSFEDFLFLAVAATCSMEQNHCGHLGFLIDIILARFDQEVILLLQSKFLLKRPKVWKEMSKIDFQDGGCGGHLGFSIG